MDLLEQLLEDLQLTDRPLYEFGSEDILQSIMRYFDITDRSLLSESMFTPFSQQEVESAQAPGYTSMIDFGAKQAIDKLVESGRTAKGTGFAYSPFSKDMKSKPKDVYGREMSSFLTDIDTMRTESQKNIYSGIQDWLETGRNIRFG